jgi:hypothetical protein
VISRSHTKVGGFAACMDAIYHSMELGWQDKIEVKG